MQKKTNNLKKKKNCCKDLKDFGRKPLRKKLAWIAGRPILLVQLLREFISDLMENLLRPGRRWRLEEWILLWTYVYLLDLPKAWVYYGWMYQSLSWLLQNIFGFSTTGCFCWLRTYMVFILTSHLQGVLGGFSTTGWLGWLLNHKVLISTSQIQVFSVDFWTTGYFSNTACFWWNLNNIVFMLTSQILGVVYYYLNLGIFIGFWTTGC